MSLIKFQLLFLILTILSVGPKTFAVTEYCPKEPLICVIDDRRTELKKVTVSCENDGSDLGKVEAIYEESLRDQLSLSPIEWIQKNITIPSPAQTAFGAFRLILQDQSWVVFNYRTDPLNQLEIYNCK